MTEWLKNWGKWFAPITGSIGIFLFMHFMQRMGGFLLPATSVVGLSLIWGITALGYLLRLRLLNRIGGTLVLVLALAIMAGMLLPAETIQQVPDKASQVISRDFDAAWRTLYGKNIFKEFNLHRNLMQYAESLSNFDTHRAGQVGLFGLFGMAMGICFLFPIDPYHRWLYWRRLLLLGFAGALWSLQMELLQILSPTRGITFVGFLESLIGILAGLGIFALFNVVYAVRKNMHTARRFNVLGVGIDAVNMRDCLDLFEEIIGSQALGIGHEALGTGHEALGTRHEALGTENDAWRMEHGVCGGAALECGGSTPLSEEDSLAAKERIEHEGSLGQGAGNEALGTGQQATDSGPSSVIRHLSSGLKTRLPAMTTAMGVAGIVESRRNQKLQRILNESVLNTPDGMPLVWLGKLFGYRSIDRVYGPDLLRDVCAYGADKGWRHFFYGAAPGIVEKLKAVLEERHPDIEIAGIYCPPFRPLTDEEEAELVDRVNRSHADIFWIGISTPKQLYFMDAIRDKLTCKIICPVGYAFDVNGGVEKDAPDWIKAAGLQWLHRAIKQPRLWRRYLPDNPAFVIKVFAQITHLKKFPLFVHERPVEPYADAEGYPRFPAGAVALSAMTLQGARDRVAHWIDTGQKHYVNICTADTVVQCHDQPKLADIVMKAGMATTDGMPLVWLARHFGFKDATRVYGPDLMLKLCELSEERGYTHYFYGATDKVLAQLKENLLQKFPKLQIAGMYSPPFRPLNDEEKSEVSERINAANPDIVWCGLGTPKQDYWVAEFRPRLNAATLLAVGAAFNFHAGHIRQAPRWMMRSGLEWLFRLCLEPRRLWRRYIIGNPRFIIQTLKQWRSIHPPMGSNSPAPRVQRSHNESSVNRTNVLGVGVSAINMADVVDALLDARTHGKRGYVCVTGVHGVIESQRDAELKRIHNRSFLTVPDGMPTVWMGREQGFVRMGRVYGPDLMLALCAATSGGSQALGTRHEALGTRNQEPGTNISINPPTEKKCFTHFLYGSTPEVLEKLKANLERKFPGIEIVGTFSPPFRALTEDEERELQQMVAACKPDFFWVGLSTPKQERFMATHAPMAQGEPVDSCSMIVDKENPRTQPASIATDNLRTQITNGMSGSPSLINPSTDSGAKRYPLDAGILLGVGAAFDIHAGLLKDAPEWVKNSGLQWFYRLCQEPKRLWRRYLDIVPTFLWLVFLQIMGVKKYIIEDDGR